MSDNRTLAKGMMIGGAPVYNNVESTTDTTMPSTSFFKTEDVDGKPVIISRDNIMGIVKDCLGSILNGLTDQTTVTKVPTLNGDTLGASAVSTLASVLGVMFYGAVDDTKATNLLTFQSGVTPGRIKCFYNQFMQYIVLEGNSSCIQFRIPYYAAGGYAMKRYYVAGDSSFTEWSVL